MAKQAKRTYNEETKIAALSLYEEVGPAETARRLKMPASTVKLWARQAGIQLASPPPHIAKAVETFKAVTERDRAEMAANLTAAAKRLTERFYEPEIDHKGQQAKEVQYDEITFASARQNAEAISKLLDKVQLLTGQATERPEQVGRSDMESWLLAASEGYEAAKSSEKTKSK